MPAGEQAKFIAATNPKGAPLPAKVFANGGENARAGFVLVIGLGKDLRDGVLEAQVQLGSLFRVPAAARRTFAGNIWRLPHDHSLRAGMLQGNSNLSVRENPNCDAAARWAGKLPQPKATPA
jgi:hypothetical protein